MGRSNDIRAAVIDDLTFDVVVDEVLDITVENRDGEVALAGRVLMQASCAHMAS